jgi:septal ring factor EnvC (AmiA/AmiB activator)
MSKKASISKRGGHPTGPLRDVGKHENHGYQPSSSDAEIDPLAFFDVLLPVYEDSDEAVAANSKSEATESQKVLVQPPTASDSALPKPVAEPAAQSLNSDSATAAQVDLFQSLRWWESELRQTEIDLQTKAADLAARRRDFAREIRSQRRALNRTETAIACSDQPLGTNENTDSRLTEMQSQIEMLVMLLRDAWPSGGNPSLVDHSHNDRETDAAARAELDSSIDGYLAEIDSLKSQVESLVEQNNQLATELAHLTVQRTVDQSSDAAASMSWEERKELLYRQFESEDNGVPFNPQQLTSEQCSRLNHEMACMQQELRARESEIAELRALLEQRPEVQDSDLAVGAASITRLFDDDELIREERSRLKDIQAEWEAKFRDMEIAASIERASLARERRQLECQNAELEEQLAHLKQELRQESIAGPAQSRRWYAKLGLGE